MDLFQFFPTPEALAYTAYKMFKNQNITRLLEPSAGRADLLYPIINAGHGYNKGRIDCIELDLDNQAILREKGLNVIDGDFLAFEGRGAFYSHILMNPPFAKGVEHTLKAWDILYDGELVSIINAANIEGYFNPKVKAPKNAKYELLVKLIKDHGEVRFVDQPFMDPDTKRKTRVRVALVHLVKKGSLTFDFFNDLEQDNDNDLGIGDVNQNQLAIPASTIKNLVMSFNAAVEAMKENVIAEEKAAYYASLIGVDLRKKVNEEGNIVTDTRGVIEKASERYTKLKESAWRKVLDTTEFHEQLSSKAAERLERQFEDVLKLEFTTHNIYGLLLGLVEQKGQMQAEMVADVFDSITRYHSENRAYYKGWKSNDRHRDGCYRIKMTRFIIPVSTTLPWSEMRRLADYDKVFAMLDSKQKPDVSLYDTFNDKDTLRLLTQGERVSTSYFDVRFYTGVGTIHFYPKRKDLIERMNRVVGKLRSWLPDDETASDPRFWEQYEQAEKVTRKMDQIKKDRGVSDWEIRTGRVDVEEIHAEACTELGIELPALGWDDSQVERPSLPIAVGA